MKLHLKKEKIEEKGFLGLGIGKSKFWWSVKVKLELDEWEKVTLNENKDLLKMPLLEHYWLSQKLAQNHPIEWLIQEKGDGYPYVADSNAELLELENKINDAVKTFKNQLIILSQAKGGSSITEF